MTKKKADNIDPLILEMGNAGLSRNEAVIYLHLLKVGRETGAAKIALSTGIHRQYVYVTLEKLINLGLVIRIDVGARGKYRAMAPSAFERMARRNFDTASGVANRLSQVSALGHEQDFEIFVGDKQVWDYEFEYTRKLNDGESQYVISGASGNFFAYFGDEYEDLAREWKEKKLHTYYVGGVHEAESLARAHALNPYFEFKFLPGMPNGVTSTAVRHESVVLYSLAKPALVYVIRSKRISEEYKAYFDMLWNIANTP